MKVVESAKMTILLVGALICFGADDLIARSGERIDKIGVRIFAWSPVFDATARVASPDASEAEERYGVQIDLPGELGVEDRSTLLGAELELPFWRRSAFNFEYFKVNNEGSDQIEANIYFAGKKYSVGETVEGSLSISMISGGYFFNIVQGAYGALALGVKVFFATLNARLDSKFAGATEKGYAVPIPMGAVSLKLKPFRVVTIAGSGEMIAVDNSSIHGYKALLEIEPVRHLALFGGWRHLGVDVKSFRDVTLDASWSGLYGGIALTL